MSINLSLASLNVAGTGRWKTMKKVRPKATMMELYQVRKNRKFSETVLNMVIKVLSFGCLPSIKTISAQLSRRALADRYRTAWGASLRSHRMRTNVMTIMVTSRRFSKLKMYLLNATRA